jgi:hypothetical protein
LITMAPLASVTSRASTKTGSSAKPTSPSVKSQTPIRKSTTTSSSIRTSPSTSASQFHLFLLTQLPQQYAFDCTFAVDHFYDQNWEKVEH